MDVPAAVGRSVACLLLSLGACGPAAPATGDPPGLDAGAPSAPNYKPVSACASKLTLYPVPVVTYGPSGDVQGGVVVGTPMPACDELGFWNCTDANGQATIWAEAGSRQLGAAMGSVFRDSVILDVGPGLPRTSLHIEQCTTSCWDWKSNGVHQTCNPMMQ
jgi:hypothetical protein